MTVNYGGGKGRTDANTMIAASCRLRSTKITSNRNTITNRTTTMTKMGTIQKNLEGLGFDV